jgi:hypothetical protein
MDVEFEVTEISVYLLNGGEYRNRKVLDQSNYVTAHFVSFLSDDSQTLISIPISHVRYIESHLEYTT